MTKSLKILKMKDNSDSFVTKKRKLFDLPMRLLIIGKTGDAKSTYLGNLLLREEMYRNDFEPDNIFIFSGSLAGDKKMRTIIEELDIPKSNLYSEFDNDMLNAIYELLEEQFKEKTDEGIKDKKKLNSLIIFDDLAYQDTFKSGTKDDGIRRIFFNGRKFLISCIIISQKYTSVGTSLRENASGLVLGKSSNKQLEIIEQDHNYLTEGKKKFLKMYREATDKPFGKLVINFSEPNLYFNQDFEPI